MEAIFKDGSSTTGVLIYCEMQKTNIQLQCGFGLSFDLPCPVSSDWIFGEI